MDVGTLNILAKKQSGVETDFFTFSNKDAAAFNAQYPVLIVKYMKAFHERFLILDDKTEYHIGASLKDAGNKCFGITQIQDEQTVKDILDRLAK